MSGPQNLGRALVVVEKTLQALGCRTEWLLEGIPQPLSIGSFTTELKHRLTVSRWCGRGARLVVIQDVEDGHLYVSVSLDAYRLELAPEALMYHLVDYVRHEMTRVALDRALQWVKSECKYPATPTMKA